MTSQANKEKTRVAGQMVLGKTDLLHEKTQTVSLADVTHRWMPPWIKDLNVKERMGPLAEEDVGEEL